MGLPARLPAAYLPAQSPSHHIKEAIDQLAETGDWRLQRVEKQIMRLLLARQPGNRQRQQTNERFIVFQLSFFSNPFMKKEEKKW